MHDDEDDVIMTLDGGWVNDDEDDGNVWDGWGEGAAGGDGWEILFPSSPPAAIAGVSAGATAAAVDDCRVRTTGVTADGCCSNRWLWGCGGVWLLLR